MITKSQKYHYRYAKKPQKKHRFFKDVLSIALAFSMMISICAVSLTSVSALKCTPFNHNETIYIDLREFTNWESSSANIKVYTYYADSDEDWNVENDANDSGLNNATALAKAITPVQVIDHVYSFNIPNGNVGYVKILRTSSDNSTIWNNSGFKYAKDRSSGNNCIKITGWDNSASWTTYSAGGGSVVKSEYDAIPDSSITDNSNLFQIDSTFYDYYTDTEYTSGWRNYLYKESHGDWEPYQTLNKELANYARTNSVRYPLYFGNFFDKNDGYVGEGSSNMYNFSNWVNNSSRLGNYHNVVIGLTYPFLVDDNISYNKVSDSGVESDGSNMPLFDKEWLKEKKLATIVNTKFPMRIDNSSSVPYYEFDSKNGKDNIYFSNYDSEELTVSYGAGKDNYAIYDALSNYGGSTNGVGFFPFDYRNSHSEHTNDAWDYGFGMRVDIDFNVANGGTIDGVQQVFNFSGDDDVWVYIDGVLVLDLGGDHKEAQGSINFATLQSSLQGETNANSVYGTKISRNGSFPSTFGENKNEAFDNNDPSKTHTLTMFYMERGMSESNLKFGFNFSPVGNQFVTEKTVDTANVNDGLKTAVASNDSFTFNHKSSSTESNYTNSTNKSYTGNQSSGSTGSNGNFSLKNGGNVTFNDQFTVGDYFDVTESIPSSSKLSYTTSWIATDTVTGDTIAQSSGDSKEAKFRFQTTDTTSDFAATRINLAYTNTPTVGSFDLTKLVKDSKGNTMSASDTNNQEFNATITVSLDGGANYSAYPLKYTIAGSDTTYTLTSSGKLDAKLKAGTTLHFDGIPSGAVVKVVEDAASGYTWTDATGTGVTAAKSGTVVSSATLTVDSSGAMTITNTQDAPGETTAVIEATKTLDGTNYTGSLFSFELKGISSNLDSASSKQISSINGGSISFSSTGNDLLHYTDAGEYRYVLTESQQLNDTTSNDGALPSEISTDSSVYLVSVTVTKNSSNQLVAGAPVYYSTTKSATSTFTDEDFVDSAKLNSAPTFANTTQKGDVSIVKKDNTGSPVSGITFTVYKVSGDNGKIEDSNAVKSGLTDSQGKATISELDIYKSGYATSGTTPEYQWYAIKEIQNDATSSFNDNTTVHYFRFHEKSDGAWVYSFTYDYVNTFSLLPDTYGNGLTALKVVGICITGFAGLLLCIYLVYSKKFSKRRIKLEK